MRRLLALWTKEWIALSRDLHGLAVLFLMPAAFIAIMSLALSDTFGERSVDFAVLGKPELAQELAGHGFRFVPPPQDEAAARDAVRRGQLGLVLVVRDWSTSDFRLLADPTLPQALLSAFQMRVLSVGYGAKPAEMLQSFPTEIVGAPAVPNAGRLSSVQQNVPAWLIFGMFFVVLPMASLFIVERRDGTLARLVTQRVPFALLLAGKIGPYFLINLAQAGLMLLVGRYVVPWLGGEALALPARWDLLVLAAVCTSLAALGWGLLVASGARTLEQATVIGGVGNILAAALGGIMVPRFVMPQAMQRWAELSPMAWALDAFHAVMLRGATAAELALPCAKLLALGALLLAAAFWLHRRRGA
jgi:ABC-2 type transport system permease protein